MQTNSFHKSLNVQMGETLKYSNGAFKTTLVGDGKLEEQLALRSDDTFQPGATTLDDLQTFVSLENQLSKNLVPYRKPDGSQPRRVGKRMQAKARAGVQKELDKVTDSLPGAGWEAGRLHIFNDGEGYTLNFQRQSEGVSQEILVAHNTDWPDDRGNVVEFSTATRSQKEHSVEQTLRGVIDSETGKLNPESEYLSIRSQES